MDHMRAAPAAVLVALVVSLAGACSNSSKAPVGGVTAPAGSPTTLPVSPKVTPATDYGPPPAGVPLIYVQDPGHSGRLIGYDWTGKPRGTVKAEPSTSLTQSPDGSLFVTGLGPKGGGQGYLDRLAQPMAGPGNPPNTVNAIWADDSVHMCMVTLDQQTYAWGFSVQQPGEAARQITVIAQDQGIGQSGISPVSCSFKSNTAILLRTSIAWPHELWVVRTSDGTVLAHHVYASASLAGVIATPDGAYVAESSSQSQSPNAPGASNTTIRRASDWSVAAALTSTYQILGFSGDDSMALVLTQPPTETVQSHLEVIDWRNGVVVWRHDGPDGVYRILGQPEGSSFAVAMGSPTPTGNLTLTGILIVYGDGTTVALPSGELPAW
ncbi:MAG: hypothetical protein ACHQ0J_07810 [Candidatus Dormibacterales bacterium]